MAPSSNGLPPNDSRCRVAIFLRKYSLRAASVRCGKAVQSHPCQQGPEAGWPMSRSLSSLMAREVCNGREVVWDVATPSLIRMFRLLEFRPEQSSLISSA